MGATFFAGKKSIYRPFRMTPIWRHLWIVLNGLARRIELYFAELNFIHLFQALLQGYYIYFAEINRVFVRASFHLNPSLERISDILAFLIENCYEISKETLIKTYSIRKENIHSKSSCSFFTSSLWQK